MKHSKIKVVATSFLLLVLVTSSFSQTSEKKAEGGSKNVAKLAKAKVPKEVTDIWFEEYPTSEYVDWYGYPVYGDYLSDWYYDWYDYDYDHYVHTEYPEYYVAEYTHEKTPSKTIYSKAGKKMATHKKLKSDLPVAVSSAMSKGAYKEWKVGTDKEEIYKDTDKDQLKVYKVEVEKGKERHVLYFQNDGKLLKDKKLKSMDK